MVWFLHTTCSGNYLPSFTTFTTSTAKNCVNYKIDIASPLLFVIYNAQSMHKHKIGNKIIWKLTRCALPLHHICVLSVLSLISYTTLESCNFVKMPKERQTSTSKAARYAEYKRLEDQKLFAGVQKFISFINMILFLSIFCPALEKIMNNPLYFHVNNTLTNSSIALPKPIFPRHNRVLVNYSCTFVSQFIITL